MHSFGRNFVFSLGFLRRRHATYPRSVTNIKAPYTNRLAFLPTPFQIFVLGQSEGAAGVIE